MYKIVIVDDEAIIRQRLTKLLKLDGYETFSAENGLDGLKLMELEDPDVVLLDVKMPGMDGIEVLRNMKAMNLEAEVILVTGHGGVDMAINAMREGAFGYVQKPVDYDELELDIKKALEKRLITRQLDEYVKQLEALVAEKTVEIERRRKAEEELENHRHNLEETVNERTRELHESKIYLDTIIDSMDDALLVYNPDGTIRFANKAAGHILGRDQEVLCQSTVADIMPIESFKAGLVQAMKNQVGLHNVEGIFLHREGHHIPVLFSGAVLPDQQGNFSGFICVAKDITSLKETERKLQEKQTMLIHSGRLSSLGEMATGIAHEINQPLTYINTVLQVLIEKLKKNEVPVEKMLPKCEQAVHQTERITRIINHLRCFGRTTNDSVQSLVHLQSVMENALILLKDKMRLNSVQFVADIEENLPDIFGHPCEVEQVFINLFQNAIDAMADTPDKAITVQMKREDGGVVIRVADNGKGMTPEIQRKIFDPFYTTKKVGEGTGMGLSITFRIIKTLGGEIVCNSTPGQGTEFVITLPLDRRRDSQ